MLLSSLFNVWLIEKTPTDYFIDNGVSIILKLLSSKTFKVIVIRTIIDEEDKLETYKLFVATVFNQLKMLTVKIKEKFPELKEIVFEYLDSNFEGELDIESWIIVSDNVFKYLY